MKIVSMVANKKDMIQVERILQQVRGMDDTTFEPLYVDSSVFKIKRRAGKIINDYAVTQLPFVVLSDDTLPEDQQEYAAVYSEEGPITIERIKAKL